MEQDFKVNFTFSVSDGNETMGNGRIKGAFWLIDKYGQVTQGSTEIVWVDQEDRRAFKKKFINTVMEQHG